MRSDQRCVAVTVLLLAATAPLALGTAARPSVAIVKSSTLGPFEQATAAMVSALRADPRQPEIMTFDLEGEQANGPAVMARARAAGPALVVTVGSLATAAALADAALQAPVVFTMVLYPRESGFVGTSARPLTGVALDVPVDVQLERLHALLPAAKRVGVLYNPAETGRIVEAAREAAARQGLTLVARVVEQPSAAVGALESLMDEVDAVWSVADSHVFGAQTTEALVLAAMRRRMPLVGLSTAHVRSGALAALYVDYADVGVQTAGVVGRLLGGEPPGDVAVAGPRRVLAALNLRTAKHIGIDVPAALEAEAGEVVR